MSTELTIEQVEQYCTVIQDSWGPTTGQPQENMRESLGKVELSPTFNTHLGWIDDDYLQMSSYMPHLVAATKGNLSLFVFDPYEDTIEAALEKIRLAATNILLVDYELGTRRAPAYGDDLVKLIKADPNAPICVGFSGEPSNDQRFYRAGAEAFLWKTSDPVRIRERMWKLLTRLTDSPSNP